MNERDLVTARYSLVGRLTRKVCPLCKQRDAWEEYQRHLFLPVLSMELENGYSYEDCLLAAGRVRGLPGEFIGPLAHTLYGRVARGNATLQQAIDAVQYRVDGEAHGWQ